MKLRALAKLRYRSIKKSGRGWLETYPRLKSLLDLTGALHTEEQTVARGVAIGLFIGLTPTVGVQTLLMVAGCIALRGNFLAAFAISWISNPFTVPALYWVFHEVGALIISIAGINPAENFSRDLLGLGDEIVITVLGSLLIATPVAIAGYLSTLYIIRLTERPGPQQPDN